MFLVIATHYTDKYCLLLLQYRQTSRYFRDYGIMVLALLTIGTLMKHFAVIGNPIAHSKSPEIHAAFAAQCGIKLKYTRLLAEPSDFTSIATNFFINGFGANITVPFKEEALRFAAKLTPDAAAAGAVNTLSKADNLIIGDNTDGIGLVRDIRDNHQYNFQKKKVLILGAGGAARGAILPIAREKPDSIIIVNRTHAKAQQLAEQFAANTTITALTLKMLNCSKQSFDIIINATSASLTGQTLSLPLTIFNRKTLAYDMMYSSVPTAFMQLSQKHGAAATDGLGMLVEQAAESFKIWHGIKPDTQTIIHQARIKR